MPISVTVLISESLRGRNDTRFEKMFDLKPTDLRASEIEALAWSSTTGWADAPRLDLPALLRRIARAVLPARRSDLRGLSRIHDILANPTMFRGWNPCFSRRSRVAWLLLNRPEH